MMDSTGSARFKSGVTRLVPLSRSARLRLPSADNEHEHCLLEANQRGRDHSAEILQRLIPTLELSEPTLLRPHSVHEGRLARLFDLDLLDVLVDHGADPGRIGMSNWEFLGDATSDALSPTEQFHAALAARSVREGGRLVLTGIERTTPGLRRLAEHVSRLYSSRISIRAVVGAGAFSGQTSTVLPDEFLIIPVLGYRRVEVGDNSDDRGYRGPLGPGEALHLRRGTRLRSHPANELCVHLEVQISRPVAPNLLPLASELAGELFDWSDLLSAEPALLASWHARLPARPATTFSSLLRTSRSGITPDRWVRPVFPGGWCLVDEEDHGEQWRTLVAAGIGLAVPLQLLPLLPDRLYGPAVAGDAFAGNALQFVQLLAETGLCELLDSRDALDSWDGVEATDERHAL